MRLSKKILTFPLPKNAFLVVVHKNIPWGAGKIIKSRPRIWKVTSGVGLEKIDHVNVGVSDMDLWTCFVSLQDKKG